MAHARILDMDHTINSLDIDEDIDWKDADQEDDVPKCDHEEFEVIEILDDSNDYGQ